MLKVFFMIHLLPWIHVLAEQCDRPYSQSNFKIQGHVIDTHSLSKRSQCTQKCASHKHCHSINYYQRQSICELNNANHLSNPESLTFSSDSEYVNYGDRPPARCSNKLCSAGLCCVVDGQSYTCSSSCQVLMFPRKSTADKIVVEKPFVNLKVFTASVWAQADSSSTMAALFSYATTAYSNHLLIILFELETRVLFRDSNIKIPGNLIDGEWHHYCITWENIAGEFKVYIDGTLKIQKTAFHVGHVLDKGVLIVGQDQDSYYGGLDAAQGFLGYFASFNMWDKVLTGAEVTALAKQCPTVEGSLMKWSDLKDKAVGAVELVYLPFCR